MKHLSRILFPTAVMLLTTGAALGIGRTSPFRSPLPAREHASAANVSYAATSTIPVASASKDTVLYPADAYKQGKQGHSDVIIDSLAVALDKAGLSLAQAQDSSGKLSPRDSLKQLLDSSLWDKLDSIYIADSTAKAKAAFEKWYAGLDKKARKKYDAEQKAKLMTARADSLRKVKEHNKEIRDSITENTPRILETYALPDSMQYKRIIAWTAEQDFGKIKPFVPDTSYNYHYYDYPFQRNDVNATWLGVAGSPVQYYDWFKRRSDEGVEFYDALESWSASPRTTLHYNSKTPYTELCYFGTLFGKSVKESDNLHLFTTQNITPEFNFSLLYDRFGGGGMLEREETANKATAVQLNYLGKKYTMHAGYIRNMVTRQENGGMQDTKWVSDTTVDARDIPINLLSASSKTKKNTFFLEQQLRIPFTFIERIKASRDSTYHFNADSLDRDLTSAFIGHSSELSTYTREYTDRINDDAGRAFYNNVFNYDPVSSADSMRVRKFDNKLYIRLQPWSSEAVVSKLDLGVGDVMRMYFDSTSVRPTTHKENSFYAYAGAEGQLRNYFFWDAKGKLDLFGANAGDFFIQANGQVNLYPFRRARKSPLCIKVGFETRLDEPTYYLKHISTNHFKWDNEFSKTSTTTIKGDISIPRWKFDAGIGYALLSGNTYYDTKGIVNQAEKPMSILSAHLRKEFVFGPLHLDNKILLQYSSDQNIVPVPNLALNLRYYLQFVLQKNDLGNNILAMQVGANAFYNTAWNSPSWNPALGVFHNQNERSYTNGPYFDVFFNFQWKRACIFVKYQNAGQGWPMSKSDYFSADRYIVTQRGFDGLKIGIYWPFYIQPTGRPVQQR